MSPFTSGNWQSVSTCRRGRRASDADAVDLGPRRGPRRQRRVFVVGMNWLAELSVDPGRLHRADLPAATNQRAQVVSQFELCGRRKTSATKLTCYCSRSQGIADPPSLPKDSTVAPKRLLTWISLGSLNIAILGIALSLSSAFRKAKRSASQYRAPDSVNS